MDFYSVLQVSFRAARNEPVAALAREHLARLSNGPTDGASGRSTR